MCQKLWVQGLWVVKGSTVVTAHPAQNQHICQYYAESVLSPQPGFQAMGDHHGHMPGQLFSCPQPPSRGLANLATNVTKGNSAAGLTAGTGTQESYRPFSKAEGYNLPSTCYLWDLSPKGG